MSATATKLEHYEDSAASSDSDDFLKIFYSSSSHDRSSVGSIPWAEDAIKQNQQQWDRIERMFYGEEDLPEDDPDLRKEIIEWTAAFPHLRVVGKKLNSDDVHLVDDTEDKVCCFDDLVGKAVSNSQKIDLNHGFIIHPEAKSIYLDMDLAHLLDKDLRIHSVPMVSRRRQLTNTSGHQNSNSAAPVLSKPPFRSILKTNNSSVKSARHQVFPSSSTNALLSSAAGRGNPSTSSKAAMSTSKSARIVRMPPIVNFIMPPVTKYLPSGSSTTHFFLSPESRRAVDKAQAEPKHEPLVLPILKIDRRQLPMDGIYNRSISAAMNDRRMCTTYLTNSASKFKIAK